MTPVDEWELSWTVAAAAAGGAAVKAERINYMKGEEEEGEMEKEEEKEEEEEITEPFSPPKSLGLTSWAYGKGCPWTP